MDPMRDRILASATALFVERGYDGVAMREISDACGITKAALYYHFGGKSDVLRAIFTTYLAEMAGVVEASAQHATTAEEQLRWLVRRLFALPPERRAVMRLAMHDMRHLAEEHRAGFATAYRTQFVAPLEAILRSGMENGEFTPGHPALAVWMLLGMLYPFFSPSGAAAPQSPDTVVDAVLDTLLNGLKTRGIAPAPSRA